jgi:hypothetical protein
MAIITPVGRSKCAIHYILPARLVLRLRVTSPQPRAFDSGSLPRRSATNAFQFASEQLASVRRDAQSNQPWNNQRTRWPCSLQRILMRPVDVHLKDVLTMAGAA